MKISIFLSVVLLAGPAIADPGHLAGVAGGHDHWLAAVAAAAALAAAVWGAFKGKRDDAEDADTQEA